MRTLIILIMSILSMAMHAQKGTQTVTLTVKGNCEECKARIENAADIKGVKLCSWDDKTQVAKIVYQADKVTIEEIEKAIAKSGHDAGKTASDDAAYKKLPKCCQYKDHKCEDKK